MTRAASGVRSATVDPTPTSDAASGLLWPATHRAAILGSIIAHYRRKQGVAQREFASRIALSPSALSRIESGVAQLGLARLHSIAAALAFDAADLLQMTDGATDRLTRWGVIVTSDRPQRWIAGPPDAPFSAQLAPDALAELIERYVRTRC